MIPDPSERALVLAPPEEMAEAARALALASIRTVPCAGLDALLYGLDAGAGLAVVAAAAVGAPDRRRLADWIGAQPEWSDLPFILLVDRAGPGAGTPDLRALLEELGNVAVLERPYHEASLASLARSALRDRRRQYEARARIEALRAAEALICAQAEEMQAVLDSVPAGIWITHDPEAREIAGNARSHEFLRVPHGRNQSKGAPGAPTGHFRFLDEEGRELAPRDLPVQTAARGIPVAGREYRVAFDDGSHIDLFGNAMPLHDAQGALAGAVAAFMDITARKAAEAALREETRSLETLNRAGAALAGELDLERLVQSLTDAGVELSGAAHGAFFHKVAGEGGERLELYTLSGADRAASKHPGGERATGIMAPLLRNEGVVRSDDVLADPRYGWMEPHHGVPPGQVPVRSYLGVPVVSRSGEVLGGLLFGHPEPGRFTERHERLMAGLAAQAAIALDNARLFQAVQRANETLETRVAERSAQLLQAREALQQAQKMEAVGQLTGGIAHDFNNLLQGVAGSLELIRRKAGDPERVRALAEAGLEAASRGARLTAQLLAFSRAQRIEARPVAVSRLVTEMRDLLERTLGPITPVRLDLATEDVAVLSDPTQLEMAMLNLAINARDAMPDGGAVTIATRLVEVAEDPELEPGDYVEIAVRDEGAGMPAEVAARAFEPFFTTKGVGKGTGLGLSQVYGIARQSGGTARLESREGLGTTVRLLLRRTVPPVLQASAAPEGPGQEPALAATILVVDDDAEVRRLLAESLDAMGATVREARDGPSGLALLERERPDVLLVDYAMPGMSGADLARAARGIWPDLPVVFATGYADTAAIEAAVGPSGRILRKPFGLDELRAAVTEALGRRAATEA